MNRQAVLKLYASCLSALFLIGCGNNSQTVGSQSCQSAQGVHLAFQSVTAQMELTTKNGQFQLLIKFANPDQDLQSFQSEIQSEAKMKQLSEDRWLVEFSSTSPAKQIVDSYIQSGKILDIEEDQQTYGLSEESLELDAAALDMTPSEAMTAAPVTPPMGPEVVVAIIDSGVDYTHKDLQGFIWTNSKEVAGNGIDDDQNGFVDDVRGWDFVNEDNEPMADDTKSYHGTHVAGIVKQAALVADKGVNVKIMALKYLDSASSGRTSNAIRAIDYAVKNGAVILNNSWGSFGYSAALSDAIDRSRLAGTLFLAASGNGDSNGVAIDIDSRAFYPASFPHGNVISVSASTSADTLAGWANYGKQSVDLAAPGVSILSSRNGNSYARLTGTSMATPYVAGVAAMLWAQRPDLSSVEIRKIILKSVSSGKSFEAKLSTQGQVNWSASIQLAQNYQHDPNDKGVTEIVPKENICSN